MASMADYNYIVDVITLCVRTCAKQGQSDWVVQCVGLCVCVCVYGHKMSELGTFLHGLLLMRQWLKALQLNLHEGDKNTDRCFIDYVKVLLKSYYGKKVKSYRVRFAAVAIVWMNIK